MVHMNRPFRNNTRFLLSSLAVVPILVSVLEYGCLGRSSLHGKP